MHEAVIYLSTIISMLHRYYVESFEANATILTTCYRFILSDKRKKSLVFCELMHIDRFIHECICGHNNYHNVVAPDNVCR